MRHVTHEWAGEPHASASIKRVDGVEVARNYALDPRVTLDGYWNSFLGGSSFEFGFGDGPVGDTSTYGRSIGRNATASSIRLRSETSPVDKGAFFAIRVWARVLSDSVRGVRLIVDESQNNGGNFQSVGATSNYAGIWQKLVETFSMASNTYSIRASLDIRDVVRQGDEIQGTGLMVVVANTESDALAQVETYFDGNTPDYYYPDTLGLFKVRANGAWHPVAPKAFLGGAFRDR